MASNELSRVSEVSPDLLVDVREFVVDRLNHYYRDRGYGAGLISACLSSGWETLPDLNRRLAALDAFMGQEDATELAAANKRIGNILRKADESFSKTIDIEALVLEEEKRLFEEIVRLETRVTPQLDEGDYVSALKHLAGLRRPVDAFFEAVMVMDEDPMLRHNRLALLERLKSLFDRIADLSVLG